MHNDHGAPIWVLADDRAGNVAQCVGVAEALGGEFQIKSIRYDSLGRLPNVLRGASLLGVDGPSRDGLSPPWPRLVIAAGRRTAPIARWIKRRSGARLVQIMDPGPGGRDEFDLIAIPSHDGHPPVGANVLPIIGAPHRVTAAKLDEAAALWRQRFSHLPRPWVGLVVGGATRHRPFTAAMAHELGERVTALAGGASVLVTTSRRTGAEAEQALVAALPPSSFVHRWGAEGDNPYFGFLALADALVVTGDSVSMVCEACAAPAPVYIFAPEGFVAPKHARLHEDLYRQGFAKPLQGANALECWSHPPLNAAAHIAAAIRERLA